MYDEKYLNSILIISTVVKQVQLFNLYVYCISLIFKMLQNCDLASLDNYNEDRINPYILAH